MASDAGMSIDTISVSLQLVQGPLARMQLNHMPLRRSLQQGRRRRAHQAACCAVNQPGLSRAGWCLMLTQAVQMSSTHATAGPPVAPFNVSAVHQCMLQQPMTPVLTSLLPWRAIPQLHGTKRAQPCRCSDATSHARPHLLHLPARQQCCSGCAGSLQSRPCASCLGSQGTVLCFGRAPLAAQMRE